ncbi:hypothetical protein ACPZ13_00260 [Streptomyces sp. IPPR8]|uniref:hypothetical protein n=1 Tax=Streptomyces sp. IPPR8 TaxID=3417301 RepID=UPI003D6889AC
MFKEFGYEVGRWDLAQLRERAPQGSFTLLDLEWPLPPDVWPGNAGGVRPPALRVSGGGQTRSEAGQSMLTPRRISTVMLSTWREG